MLFFLSNQMLKKLTWGCDDLYLKTDDYGNLTRIFCPRLILHLNMAGP